MSVVCECVYIVCTVFVWAIRYERLIHTHIHSHEFYLFLFFSLSLSLSFTPLYYTIAKLFTSVAVGTAVLTASVFPFFDSFQQPKQPQQDSFLLKCTSTSVVSSCKICCGSKRDSLHFTAHLLNFLLLFFFPFPSSILHHLNHFIFSCKRLTWWRRVWSISHLQQ